MNDEHEALVDVAGRIARAASFGSPPITVAPLDQPGWDALQDAGLVSLIVPVTAGGSGGTVLDAALVAEQLAYALAPLPFLGSVVGTRLLSDAGLNPTAGGAPTAVALTDDLSHSGAGVAWDAAGAEWAFGLAGSDVIRMPIGDPLDSVDLSRSLADVGESTVIATVTADIVDRWTALALSLLAADLLGTMHGALDAAVAHACQREQFGHPIGSYQAVQHLCAEQLVSVEATRSALWHAAWAVDELEPAEALLSARVAKAWASKSALAVCEAAIQVWGGLGMTWECRAHGFLRRALLARRTFGDERVQLRAIADARLGRLA